MISFNRDGSTTFISDTNPSITQHVAAGTPMATVDAMYATFLVANPVPVLAPPAPQIIVIPDFNHGVTGGLYLDGTTLKVSLGPTGFAQIGTTGPAGPTGVVIA